MMNNIEILKSFGCGEMSIEEFKEIYFSNKSLQDLLQEKLPQSMLINININACNGDFNKVLQNESWDTKGGKCSVHGFIKMWLKNNDIEFIASNVYCDEYSFLISIMPYCINGNEAEALIDKIVLSVPESIGKTKRIKEIKEKIKDVFHLRDGKKPRWPQDTDWPFSKSGKPLKFISQKSDGDLVMLKFVDVDTGEESIVEDFY